MHIFYANRGTFTIVFTNSRFDLSWRSQNPEVARESWRKVKKMLGLQELNTAYLTQTHSNIIRKVKKPGYQGPGDGLYSFQKEIALTVLTADCLPVVLTDPQTGFCAVLHCGWKPLAKGILNNLPKIFQRHNINPNNISAFLGPCIDQCCYQVGSEFLKIFPERFFITKDSRLYFSLKQFVTEQLVKMGIKSITRVELCTCCSSLYFSYRGERCTQRQATFVIKRC